MIATGNKFLDMELPLLTMRELAELARYAKFLRWSRDSWADMPLTPDEEAELKQGRKNVRSGNFMTLAEFREQCGQSI